MKKLIIIFLIFFSLVGIGGAIMVSAQTKATKIGEKNTTIKKKVLAKTNPPITAPASQNTAPVTPQATGSKPIETKKTLVSNKVKTKVAPVAKTKTTGGVKWTSSGLSAVRRIPSGVRPAYMRKVESYAKRNNIKSITAAVVGNMRE